MARLAHPWVPACAGMTRGCWFWIDALAARAFVFFRSHVSPFCSLEGSPESWVQVRRGCKGIGQQCALRGCGSFKSGSLILVAQGLPRNVATSRVRCLTMSTSGRRWIGWQPWLTQTHGLGEHLHQRASMGAEHHAGSMALAERKCAIKETICTSPSTSSGRTASR
jgi:hypothetical protein